MLITYSGTVPVYTEIVHKAYRYYSKCSGSISSQWEASSLSYVGNVIGHPSFRHSVNHGH
jgi:hypothetical protein